MWHAIEDTSLQILGKILLDIYVTAAKQTMFKKDDDDDDESDEGEDEEPEPIVIKKNKKGTWSIDITNHCNDPDQDGDKDTTQTSDQD